MQAMRFSKYHGLGNDYLVIDEMALMQSPERIRLICDRNFGIGSDGILFGPLPSKLALAGLRIFNPDGSEAEKSGNGIRIFCRHLWEPGSLRREPILRDHVDVDLAKRLGHKIERHSLFPNRTNVQFVKVIDKDKIQVEIWERGAGYTLASGSSASAAAAVARRLGFCGANVRVQMPGGELKIAIGDQFSVVLSGPLTKVGYGTIYDEIFG